MTITRFAGTRGEGLMRQAFLTSPSGHQVITPSGHQSSRRRVPGRTSLPERGAVKPALGEGKRIAALGTAPWRSGTAAEDLTPAFGHPSPSTADGAGPVAGR